MIPLKYLLEGGVRSGFNIPSLRNESDGRFSIITKSDLDLETGSPVSLSSRSSLCNLRLLELDPTEYVAQDPDLLARRERYLVRRGDVLFCAKGDQNKAVYVESCPEETVVPTYLFILRVKDKAKLHPTFLAWYLNQYIAQTQIRRMSQGTNTPEIPRGKFARIPIPIPPMAKQELIVSFSDHIRYEIELIHQLLAKKKEYHLALGHKILNTLEDTSETPKDVPGDSE